jgi:hypothetical protein
MDNTEPPGGPAGRASPSWIDLLEQLGGRLLRGEPASTRLLAGRHPEAWRDLRRVLPGVDTLTGPGAHVPAAEAATEEGPLLGVLAGIVQN